MNAMAMKLKFEQRGKIVFQNVIEDHKKDEWKRSYVLEKEWSPPDALRGSPFPSCSILSCKGEKTVEVRKTRETIIRNIRKNRSSNSCHMWAFRKVISIYPCPTRRPHQDIICKVPHDTVCGTLHNDMLLCDTQCECNDTSGEMSALPTNAICSWFHVLPSARDVRLAIPLMWYP